MVCRWWWWCWCPLSFLHHFLPLFSASFLSCVLLTVFITFLTPSTLYYYYYHPPPCLCPELSFVLPSLLSSFSIFLFMLLSLFHIISLFSLPPHSFSVRNPFLSPRFSFTATILHSLKAYNDEKDESTRSRMPVL